MSWKLFGGASILVVGMLVRAGVPLFPVLAGVGLGALVNWMRQRGAADRLKKPFPGRTS